MLLKKKENIKLNFPSKYQGKYSCFNHQHAYTRVICLKDRKLTLQTPDLPSVSCQKIRSLDSGESD